MGSRFGPQSRSIRFALGFLLIFGTVSTGCINKDGDPLPAGLMSFPIAIKLSVDKDADGKPKYVTAVCRSDTIDGWRDRRQDGGVVIDVETGEVVCEGLSMPHSPRWADGRLWVLNSGTGYLGTVDLATRRFVPQVFCPGFLRGLAIKGDYAAVGLSKPRNQRFDGLDLQKNLEAKDSESWCGVQVVDLRSGSVVEWVRLDGPVTELFDVTFLDGVKCPMALGQQSPENLSLVSVEGAPAAGAARRSPAGVPCSRRAAIR